MNKQKLIGFIALGLLVSNLALLIFIFKTRNRPVFNEGPKKIIIERLHFDKNQITAYEQLIHDHRKKIRSKDSLILMNKNLLYKNLILNSKATSDSIINQLGLLQIELEQINYNHFIDIKNLCTHEQLKEYNNLVKDLAYFFGRPHHK